MSVPVERLLPFLEPYLARRSVETLSERSNVSVRAIEAFRRGERKHAKFATADALLVATGQVHVWHLPPPAGLSDLYERAA